MGRPKGGKHRDTVPAKLARELRDKCKVIAESRGIPISDVIERMSGANIDRAYRRIMDARRHDTGEPVA